MRYSQEFKVAVVAHARRYSIKSAADYFKISRNTVRKWYNERHLLIKPPKTIDDYVIFEIS